MLKTTNESIINRRTPIPPIVNKRKVLFDFLMENEYAPKKRRKFTVEQAIPSRIEYPEIILKIPK